jgi:hypothetical protein
MKKIKLNILGSDVTKDGSVTLSNKRHEIKLPLSYWRTSEYSGFSMDKDGNGSYLGMAQNFGGPIGGDLVLFDTAKTSFYGIVTGMTQDYDIRKCSVKFLCFQNQLLSRILEEIKFGMIEEKLSVEDALKNILPMIGFDKSLDVCFEASKMKMLNFIYR